MDLVTAMDVLKKDRDSMELVVKLGNGTPEMEELIEATDVVFDWIDRMYVSLAKLGDIKI